MAPSYSAQTQVPAAPVPPLRGFGDSLPMALLRARESVMRHFRPMLHHFGLTEQQWRVLRALTALGETEVTRLAHATCLLGPSLSRILKDLEARDLVTRRPAEKDQRFGLISIGVPGAALVARIGIESERIYAQIAARSGAGRLGDAMALLQSLEQALGTGPLASWQEGATHAGAPAPARRGRPRRDTGQASTVSGSSTRAP